MYKTRSLKAVNQWINNVRQLYDFRLFNQNKDKRVRFIGFWFVFAVII